MMREDAGAGNTAQGNGEEKYCRRKGPERRLSLRVNVFVDMNSHEAYSEDG